MCVSTLRGYQDKGAFMTHFFHGLEDSKFDTTFKANHQGLAELTQVVPVVKS
jgi:hypothetical protein